MATRTKQDEIEALTAAMAITDVELTHARNREAELEKQLREMRGLSERLDWDAKREADNTRIAQRRIDAAKLLIASRLRVTHQCGAEPSGEMFRGQWVPDEDSEQVRWLRNLLVTIGDQIPF